MATSDSGWFDSCPQTRTDKCAAFPPERMHPTNQLLFHPPVMYFSASRAPKEWATRTGGRGRPATTCARSSVSESRSPLTWRRGEEGEAGRSSA